MAGFLMLINIVTIFPDFFGGVFNFGMIHQAMKKGLLETRMVDLREFATDKRGTVDDRPYGGGEGMVLKPELIFRAVEKCQQESGNRGHTILLSPQGKRFDQKKAKELSLRTDLILICGRYEGVDQRVADYLADEEISVGDFVLSGGEFAACLIVDAVCRLIPGVVGKGISVLEESFMEGLLDCSHYTRPAAFRGWKVPEVLLSGDHVRIQQWRRQQALKQTQKKRPDLLTEETREMEKT
ncbi:MAG: tRNA (guanosine(37)-N1)-methyltransferase TrmD [Acidobacteria bacterium]|nr:tRNA (guanosine(37)-N1)-methyltransferase TrmD [Acidobacteriota bacterium]